MAKPDDELDITVLTPKTIPEYAAKTGQSEESLLGQYQEAKSQNKVLYGLYMPPEWFAAVPDEEE